MIQKNKELLQEMEKEELEENKSFYKEELQKERKNAEQSRVYFRRNDNFTRTACGDGMEWKEMGISAVDIIVTFAGNGSYSSFSEKEISKKVLPEMWN